MRTQTGCWLWANNIYDTIFICLFTIFMDTLIQILLFNGIINGNLVFIIIKFIGKKLFQLIRINRHVLNLPKRKSSTSITVHFVI